MKYYLAWFSVILGLSSFAGMVYFGGWGLAFSIFAAMWANNISTKFS